MTHSEEIKTLADGIADRDAEIQRLKGAYESVILSREEAEDETDKLNAEIQRLKSLLARAAAALEFISGFYPQQKQSSLITELRKAAE